MKKEYLKPINIDNKSKTLKYLKAMYKTLCENEEEFKNNKYVKRMIKNGKKINDLK